MYYISISVERANASYNNFYSLKWWRYLLRYIKSTIFTILGCIICNTSTVYIWTLLDRHRNKTTGSWSRVADLCTVTNICVARLHVTACTSQYHELDTRVGLYAKVSQPVYIATLPPDTNTFTEEHVRRYRFIACGCTGTRSPTKGTNLVKAKY